MEEEDDKNKRFARKLEETASGMVRAYAIRLEPGNDLMKEMKSVAAAIMAMCSPAVFVLSCTGNLSQVTMELGKAEDIDRKMKHVEKSAAMPGPTVAEYTQPVQIVSLQGNFSQVFDPTAETPLTRKIFCNLTIFISDKGGKSIAGKLVNGTVLNSVELVFGCVEGVAFVREVERKTGEPELGVWVLEGDSEDEEQDGDKEEKSTNNDESNNTTTSTANTSKAKPITRKKKPILKKKKAVAPSKQSASPSTNKKVVQKTTTKKKTTKKSQTPKPATKPKIVAKKKK